jgi:hypothetical protein
LKNWGKVAELPKGDLGLCYWREGSYDEARIQFNDALARLGDQDVELKATLLIRAGIVEVWDQKINEALRLYYQAAPLLEESTDHALKGAFHNEFALRPLPPSLPATERCGHRGSG